MLCVRFALFVGRKDLHLCVGHHFPVHGRFACDDGDAVDFGTHGDGSAEHVTDGGAAIAVELLDLADISHGGRFALHHAPIACKGTCRLCDVLDQSGLRHQLVVLDEEIAFAHTKFGLADITFSTYQRIEKFIEPTVTISARAEKRMAVL